MNPLDSLEKIYSLAVNKGHRRVPIIERQLRIETPSDVSLDEKRNEACFFYDIAEDNGKFLEACLKSLMGELRIAPMDKSDYVLDGIEFLQSVIADVLWRYHRSLTDYLENFARDYDRLDAADVRRHLCDAVKTGGRE